MANLRPLKRRSGNLVSAQSTIKTFKEGEINYIDASSLHRPLSFPKKFYPMLLSLCVAALILAAIFGFKINDNVVHYEDKLQANVEKVVKRDIDQHIPALSSLVSLDDEGIKASLSESEIQFADLGEINNETEYSLDILSIPADMTIEEVRPVFTDGIKKLDPTSGAQLLSGSWRLVVTRGEDDNFSLKYADFNSTDPNIAIQNAMETQGLSEDDIEDEGTDASGNVFKSGWISVDDVEYKWTISACSLSSVYNIAGLPANAQYVGIRYTE